MVVDHVKEGVCVHAHTHTHICRGVEREREIKEKARQR